MWCGEQGTTASARRQRARRPGGLVSPRMFFDLTALAFGIVALILFVFAFSNVFKGKIGSAVIFGVLALIMSGAATSVAVFVD